MIYVLSDLEKLEKLGEGTYGVVHKVRHKKTMEILALKELKACRDSQGISAATLREISVLKELQHPNIVDLKQTIMDTTIVYMLFEYIETDLAKLISDRGPLNSYSIKRYSYQILQGLFHCHSRRIIHRDLKTDNLLVDLDREIIKIADFGLARTISIPIKPMTVEIMTLNYQAPEILLGTSSYGCAVDVWSVGCIIAEMAIGDYLFNSLSEIGLLFEIFRLFGTPNDDCWPDVDKLKGWNNLFPNWNCSFRSVFKTKIDEDCMDFLEGFFIYYPTKRWTVIKAMKSTYFQDLDKSTLPAFDEEYI